MTRSRFQRRLLPAQYDGGRCELGRLPAIDYCRACCASLSVLSLASPVLAVRGKPVRRAKRPPDAWLFPAHPPPYDGFLFLLAQRKEPTERATRTLRPRTSRVPSLRPRLRRSAQGPSLALARTREIHLAPLRACSSPSRVARLE